MYASKKGKSITCDEKVKELFADKKYPPVATVHSSPGINLHFGTGFPTPLPEGWTLIEHDKGFAEARDSLGNEYLLSADAAYPRITMLLHVGNKRPGDYTIDTRNPVPLNTLRVAAKEYLKTAVQYQCSPWDLRVVRAYGIAKARIQEILSENAKAMASPLLTPQDADHE